MPKQETVVSEVDVFDIETIPSPYVGEYESLDEDFVANICTKGVIVPVIAIPHEGKFVVVDGHKRIMAVEECRKRGISVPVPVRLLKMDLSSPNDAIMARILAFTINRLATGRYDEMFKPMYWYNFIEDLILKIIETGHEFAEPLARGSIPNEFARMVAQIFGVTDVTGRNWIKKVLDTSTLVSQKLAEYMAKKPQTLQQTHAQLIESEKKLSQIITSIGEGVAVKKQEKKEEEQPKPQPQTQSLLKQEQIPTANVIFCGNNAVSQEKFAVLAATQFAHTLREMCNAGVLTTQLLDELIEAYEKCGIPCVYSEAAKKWPVSGMVNMRMPVMLPQIIHAIAEEQRILYTDLSFIVMRFLQDLLIVTLNRGKVSELLTTAKQMNLMVASGKIDEAVEVFRKFASEL